MNWNSLTSTDQIIDIDKLSKTQKIFILKHSTRCSISSSALGRIERKWKDGDEKKIQPYFLDLIKYRDVSAALANHYKVEHQSPQLLVIENGQCVFSETHFDITYESLMEHV